MPKIKDLGINAIPETMRPPEIGPGGGGCGILTAWGCTPGTTPPKFAAQVDWWTCTPGTTHHGTGAWATLAALTCTPGTVVDPPQTGAYYATPHMWTCTPGTTNPPQTGAYYATPHMMWTCTPTTVFTTTTAIPGGINPQAIDQLKQQLRQAIDQLDEVKKQAGARTVEEIDAREQQLKAELDELSNRRKQIGKAAK